MSRLASNAFWNVVNLGSGALVAVVVPLFLTRFLAPQVFGAWALALQLASYVGLFGFGVQMVVARHVSIANEKASLATRDTIVATAFWMLIIGAVIAIAALVGTGVGMGWLFPQLQSATREHVGTVFITVGLALALALPTTVFVGVFAGLQRMAIPALAQVATRVLLSIGIIIVAAYWADLGLMSMVYFFITVAGAAAIALLWRHLTVAPTIAASRVARPAFATLLRECAPLTLWNLAALLVTSFSLVIVSRLDPQMIPYFAVAATLTTLLTGVLQAANTALLPIAAAMDVAGDVRLLSNFMGSATRVNGAIGLLLATPLIISGEWLLSVWVGADYALKSGPILSLLALATLVRLSAFPYATAAVATGQQHRMLITPLIEALATVAAGVLFGSRFGAIGVAIGYLIGACVGIVAMFVQHPLEKAMGGQTAGAYLRVSNLRSALILLLLVLCSAAIPTELRNNMTGAVCALIGVALLCWFVGFTDADRGHLARYIPGRRRRVPQR